MGAMRDMHGWCVGIAIDGNHLYAETLTLNCHFFTSSPEPNNITRVAAGRSAVPNNVITNIPD
ncbi:hypothetical protein ACNKHT_11695 [Shigella flexneri]